jgi:hypothetical protein
MIAMRWQFALGVLSLIALTACGSSSTSPSISLGTFHVDVTDPVGDVVIDRRIAVSPDLVEATADATASNVTFVIRFAPGTLDRQTTRVTVLIDSDRNGSTGISQGNGLGADYALDLTAITSQAAITKADPVGCAARQSCFTPIGSVAMDVTADSMLVTVPLATLAGADGRMCFQIRSYILFGTGDPVVFDSLPDSGFACLQ